MPALRHQLPPQTSKKARRAYLKSAKHFEFTPTQQRASERRLELDKRAKALQAKELRKQDSKRKREDKEASERETKRKRIESGKAPLETLWGKVRASQPRLNAFFAKPKAANNGAEDQSETEDKSSLNYKSDLVGEILDHPAEQTPQDLAADTNELENFFSSAASIRSTDMAQALEADATEAPAPSKLGDLATEARNTHTLAPSKPEDPDQALLDAQLSLSQGIFDFDIAEDDDAEWMPQDIGNINQSDYVQDHNVQKQLLATPSKRKAENGDFEFTSPAKSARSALSEMSPSKVNIRAQEKPDIFSVAPFPSKLPTPSPAKQAGSQAAAEVLAMIATQDLEDDEFLTDKENQDPWQNESKRESQKTDGVQKTTSPSSSKDKPNSPRSHNLVKKVQVQNPSFDEDIFDEDDFSALESGLEDEQDDYDNDLDDEALAALAAPSPSAHKLALMSSKRVTAMAGGKLEARQLTNPTDNQEHAQAANVMLSPKQAASTRFQVDSPVFKRPLPPATQGNNFAFDDVQDDDLTSLVEKYDTAHAITNPQIGSESKPSRTIPWNHLPQFPLSHVSDERLTPDEDPYD
jgi:hypothetical protein